MDPSNIKPSSIGIVSINPTPKKRGEKSLFDTVHAMMQYSSVGVKSTSDTILDASLSEISKYILTLDDTQKKNIVLYLSRRIKVTTANEAYYIMSIFDLIENQIQDAKIDIQTIIEICCYFAFTGLPRDPRLNYYINKLVLYNFDDLQKEINNRKGASRNSPDDQNTLKNILELVHTIRRTSHTTAQIIQFPSNKT